MDSALPNFVLIKPIFRERLHRALFHSRSGSYTPFFYVSTEDQLSYSLYRRLGGTPTPGGAGRGGGADGITTTAMSLTK